MLETLNSLSTTRDVFVPSLNGPGPTELIGSYVDPVNSERYHGFFGELTSEEFITAQELANEFKITTGTLLNNTSPWLKFLIDGKIVFTPKLPIWQGLSYELLYNRGLVYGDDDNGKYPLGIGVNQFRVINVKGYLFKVRLIKGSLNDPYSGTTSTSSTYEDPATIGSEWNRMFYNIVTGSFPSQEGEKWATYSQAEVGISTGNGGLTLCQETYSSNLNNKLLRGANSVMTPRSTVYNELVATTAWRPVLELVTEEINKPIILSINKVDKSLITEEVLFLGPDRLYGAYVPERQILL